DEAVLVDGRAQHRAPIFPVPGRVIGASAEERDAVRRAADHHTASGLLKPSARRPPGKLQSAQSRLKSSRSTPAASSASTATPGLTAVALAVSGSNIMRNRLESSDSHLWPSSATHWVTTTACQPRLC